MLTMPTVSRAKTEATINFPIENFFMSNAKIITFNTKKSYE
jgi:hypothetical protein